MQRNIQIWLFLKLSMKLIRSKKRTMQIKKKAKKKMKSPRKINWSKMIFQQEIGIFWNEKKLKKILFLVSLKRKIK